MSARRLNSESIVSKPLAGEHWTRLEKVAHQVDADLAAQDVRLTMGGEPTIVGLDEPDSPQWNGDAMGPLKLNRAMAMIRRLRDQMAPGGLSTQLFWHRCQPSRLPSGANQAALTAPGRDADGAPSYEGMAGPDLAVLRTERTFLLCLDTQQPLCQPKFSRRDTIAHLNADRRGMLPGAVSVLQAPTSGIVTGTDSEHHWFSGSAQSSFPNQSKGVSQYCRLEPAFASRGIRPCRDL
jgi:Putative amidoligase enzyme (DUF2126)